MSVNRNLPHILILPEDRANRQMATGFALGVDELRRIQVLREAGGWSSVLEQFCSTHLNAMRSNLNRSMILLFDFDNHAERSQIAREVIPSDLAERTFILGVFSEPEQLRSSLHRRYEEIGLSLADACRHRTPGLWQHPLLAHNASELDRLTQSVRPILFQH